MRIHWGVIVAWLGSVGIFELCNQFKIAYAWATIMTVVVLSGAYILEDYYGTKEFK